MVLPVVTRGMIRAIRQPKVADSIDVQMAIHHRHGASAHPGRARLMRVGYGGIADEVFERFPFQVTWHHLAPGERPKRRGVADLSAQFHAGDRSREIVWVRQKIGLNLNGVGSGLGPVRRRWPWLLGRTTPPRNVHPLAGRPNLALLGVDSGTLSLARLHVRRLSPRGACPEEGGLAHAVAWREGVLILPDAVKSHMVLKVLPDPR